MIFAVGLAGCASQTGWTPTVDPYNDPNAARIQYDLMECKQLAQQSAGSTGVETVQGAAIGGLLGAAAGAAIGAAAGNAGAGAAIGAATGGMGGAAHQGFGSEGNYKRAFNNCMRNRGHYVVN
jgi:outer membrane lipoprotein SlyB